MSTQQADTIAKLYADSVKYLTSPEEFATILERNATPDYETSDAVADFMSHEDVLLAAFKSAMARDADLSLDDDLNLLCDAHNQAIDRYLTKKD